MRNLAISGIVFSGHALNPANAASWFSVSLSAANLVVAGLFLLVLLTSRATRSRWQWTDASRATQLSAAVVAFFLLHILYALLPGAFHALATNLEDKFSLK